MLAPSLRQINDMLPFQKWDDLLGKNLDQKHLDIELSREVLPYGTCALQMMGFDDKNIRIRLSMISFLL